MSPYADDTGLFTNGSKSSIDTAILNLNDFAKISGLVTNFEKSFIFPLGTYVDPPPPPALS